MSTEDPSKYMRDPSLSLKEKWRIHMQQKRKRNTSPFSDPHLLNKWGPWTVLFLVVGAGGWGTVVAMPTLYAGWWRGWLLGGWALVAFMMLEVIINWVLTRTVGSQYNPAIHGSPPPSDCAQGQAGLQPPPAVSQCCDDGKAPTSTDTTETDSVLRSRKTGDPCAAGNGVCANGKEGEGLRRKEDSGPSTQNGFSFPILVATALPDAEGRVERKSFPYWSWVPCLMCQRPRPPRCHHCTLCRHCVLKRDHHCYMTGACIGLNNHRFFLAFLFWGTLLTVWGTCHMLPYTFLHVYPEYNLCPLDFLPPVSLVRGLLGQVSLVVAPLALLFWMLLVINVFVICMLAAGLRLLVRGQTGFEQENGIKLADTRTMDCKLRAMFGDHWWLNILLPTYPWVKPQEDGVNWPHIKEF